jgi:hypothetical protein
MGRPRGKVKKGYARHVIKLQRPLFIPPGQNGQVLIYNEDRSINTLIPYTDDLKAMFGEDPKMYYLADLPMTTSGPIRLYNEVEGLDW